MGCSEVCICIICVYVQSGNVHILGSYLTIMTDQREKGRVKAEKWLHQTFSQLKHKSWRLKNSSVWVVHGIIRAPPKISQDLVQFPVQQLYYFTHYKTGLLITYMNSADLFRSDEFSLHKIPNELLHVKVNLRTVILLATRTRVVLDYGIYSEKQYTARRYMFKYGIGLHSFFVIQEQTYWFSFVKHERIWEYVLRSVTLPELYAYMWHMKLLKRKHNDTFTTSVCVHILDFISFRNPISNWQERGRGCNNKCNLNKTVWAKTCCLHTHTITWWWWWWWSQWNNSWHKIILCVCLLLGWQPKITKKTKDVQ